MKIVKHKLIWYTLVAWISLYPFTIKLIKTYPGISPIIQKLELAVVVALLFLSMGYLIKLRFPKQGFWIFLGAVLLQIPPIISQKLGYIPHYNYTLWFLVLVLILIYMLPPIEISDFIKCTKNWMLFYIYGSLVLILIMPDWALETSYAESLISGFGIRLTGLAGHANSLAPLIYIYLVLDMYMPPRLRKRVIHNTIAMLVLILTQSKTVWIALGISYLVFQLYNKTIIIKGRKKLLSTGIVNILTSIFLLLALCFDVSEKISNFIQKNNLQEFTGRSTIWDITLDSWRLNPLFGYGLELWGPQMQNTYVRVLNGTVGTAHNQLIQTLGESGIIGVIGLTIFALIFCRYSIKYSKKSKGVTMILFMFIFIRSITEVTLPIYINNVAFNVLFVALTLLMLLSKQETKSIANKISKPISNNTHSKQQNVSNA